MGPIYLGSIMKSGGRSIDRWPVCDRSAIRYPGDAPGAPAATIRTRWEAERRGKGVGRSTSCSVP